jgi:hypothetical protein
VGASWGHSVILVTDGTGKWTLFEGGGSISKYGDRGGRPYPTKDSGTLLPGQTLEGVLGFTTSYPVKSPYTTYEDEVDALRNASNRLTQVPYSLNDANCNTYNHQLLNLGGFTPPSDFSPLGWDTSIYGGPDSTYDKYGNLKTPGISVTPMGDGSRWISKNGGYIEIIRPRKAPTLDEIRRGPTCD